MLKIVYNFDESSETSFAVLIKSPIFKSNLFKTYSKLFVIKNSLKTLNHEISIIVLVSMLLNASNLFISSCETVSYTHLRAHET